MPGSLVPEAERIVESTPPPPPAGDVTRTWGPGERAASPPAHDDAATVHDGGPAPSETTAVTERPKVAGRYVTLERLGEGGAGAVYAAYDSELHRRVALKFIRARHAGAAPDEWRARLMREATAMARLSHPNVVTLYDVGASSEDGVFLAMELVEGGTLTRWLREQPRSWKATVAMLCDAGEGLAAAHRAGMIHRDFKPDNVLLGADGRARVTDFGLARSAAEASDPSPDAPPRASAAPMVPADAPSSSALAKLTITGSIMGTPGYMAPEQYAGDVEIDARADVFAFCATLYRALYGERPFAGTTLEQIARATLQGELRAPPRGSQVPSWVRKIVARGLAPDRDARPASMAALLAELRGGMAKRGYRGVAAGAVVAVAALAIGARFVFAHPTPIAAAPTAPAPTTEARAEPPPSAKGAAPPELHDEAPAAEAPPPAKGAARSSAPRPTRPAPKAKAPPAAPSTSAGNCTIESSYDADGSPHFKRVCR